MSSLQVLVCKPDCLSVNLTLLPLMLGLQLSLCSRAQHRNLVMFALRVPGAILGCAFSGLSRGIAAIGDLVHQETRAEKEGELPLC